VEDENAILETSTAKGYPEDSGFGKDPDVVTEQRTSKKICCAVTMSGKPCSFKAICGDYCRKHSVKNATIGAKVDVSQIKIVE